jgi:drug/metabolite transporter (DMT)-like permease
MPTSSDADNLRGAGIMLASQAAFMLNDALMAVALAETGLFTAMFYRGLFATLILVVYGWQGGHFRVRLTRGNCAIIGLRSLGELGATLAYLTALAAIGLSLTAAIFQATPLAITLAAALFLGERVGWRRALAILTGFAGVLIIIRPGTEGFNAGSLWALASVGFVVARDLATRRLPHAIPSALVALATSVTITLAGGVGMAVTGWVPPPLSLSWHFVGAALFLVLGYASSVSSMRSGDVSFVAPFRYSSLVFAMLLSLAIWGTVPDEPTVAGSILVVGSGLFTLWREARLRRRARA